MSWYTFIGHITLLYISQWCVSTPKYGQSQTVTAVHLEGVHFRLLWHIVAKTPEEHVTRDRVLRLSEVPPWLAMLHQKRPATCAYRSLWLNVLDQLNKPESRWTQLIQSDCNAANISVDNLEHLAADKDSIQTINLCTHILLKITRIIYSSTSDKSSCHLCILSVWHHIVMS